MIAHSFEAIVLGVIEGLTEFLPVSSTGHLILASRWIHLPSSIESTFDVAIQLGAILAVVVYYWSFFKQWFKPSFWISKTAFLIYMGCLPALILGFLSHKFIKTYLFSTPTVLAALVVGGILMIWMQKRYTRNSQDDFLKLSLKQAFFIGVWQCLALWPGMSRSASTIMGGLGLGLSYAASAKFSFILAVPIMLAATTFDLAKNWAYITPETLGLIGLGAAVSFVVALLAIRFFIQGIQKWKLIPFAIYRFVLAGVILYLLI